MLVFSIAHAEPYDCDKEAAKLNEAINLYNVRANAAREQESRHLLAAMITNQVDQGMSAVIASTKMQLNLERSELEYRKVKWDSFCGKTK